MKLSLKKHLVALLALTGLLAGTAGAFQVPAAKLVRRGADPGGSPRPAPDARNVPLRTSLYFELEPSTTQGPKPDPQSVAVNLQPDGGDAELLRPGERFAHGVSGWLRKQGEKSLAVYIDPGAALKRQTRYVVRVSTLTGGRQLEAGSWSFTTAAAPSVHKLNVQLDLATKPVQWHGHFFSGICNVIFCSQAANYGPTYKLMAEARKQHPLAWSLQRDFWLTGFDFRPPGPFFPSNLPNIVHERETRRITAIEPHPDQAVLRVEDFFGHQQYGIASNRPVSADYHPGDEVLVADGINNARTKVIGADDAAHTVTVAPFAAPSGGWKIAYDGPLPTHEDLDAPGLFPPGGCYLRKFNPSGTACYYWGRLDKEWDLAVRRYGRRVLPNFADAPGALPLNAAFADHRLDGKRSRRVETLCRAHGGKGSPCDFVSIHSYNYSNMMAAKLAKAKEMALEIDPDYYKALWIDSHECCPNWMPPPDAAATDMYLGDGYFPAWCMDVVHRQLLRAQRDPRYAYGETILTVWPPPTNFAALNAVSRNVRVEADAEHPAKTVTIPMPIFHALNLMSDLGLGGDKYWVLPTQTIGDHMLGGFASQDPRGTIRVLLYAHDPQDLQSRSEDTFEVALDLSVPGWHGPANVTEYRIDRSNNSPFSKIKSLLAEQSATHPTTNPLAVADYPAAAIQRIQGACECRPTSNSKCPPSSDGHLHLEASVCGNGCNFLVISKPAQ
ncbi:MAG TPA: hypothetical protein VN541_22680 [Tepidisphaeraceae bacterium]|nr:hypothetical protein [Tepidisphaeraceae bacterium]